MGRKTVLVVFIAFVIAMFAPVGESFLIDLPSGGGNGLTLTGSFVSLLLFGFALLFPQKKEAASPLDVLFAERTMAGLIDCVTVGFAFISIGHLSSAVHEFFYTGQFSVRIERDFSRPTDIWTAVVGMATFAAGFCYFWLVPKSGRATLGQYIMGYKAEAAPASTSPSFAGRAFAGIVSFMMWPFALASLLVGRKTPGIYWWDRISGTRAVSVVQLNQ